MHGESVYIWTKEIRWQRSRKAKVAKLDLALPVDQQICGLDISMHQACRVEVIDGAKGVVDDGKSVLLAKLNISGLSKNFFEITIDIVHDNEQVILSIVLVRSDHIMNLARECVILLLTQETQYLNLRNNFFG